MATAAPMLLAIGAALATPTGERAPAPAPSGETYLPELTWTEVRDALQAGHTTVLVPTGGIERNGPWLTLGKHDVIAREVAQRTARELGDALVAPVVSFVPEGDIAPKTGHMRYPGTLSVRDGTFDALLTDTVRSLAAHGFEHVVLIGDSGGNQEIQAAVAERLDGRPARVHHIEVFYDPDGANGFLEQRGLSWTPDPWHDDPGFTLQLLAIDPEQVHVDDRSGALTDGFSLEPIDERSRWGDELLDWRAARTAEAIRAARKTPAPRWTDGLLELVAAPFRSFLNPETRTFVGYLLSALVIAFVVEAWRMGRGWSIPAVVRRLFPEKVWLSRDSLHDLLFFLCGGLVAFVFFGEAWPVLVEWGRVSMLWVLTRSGIDNLGLPMGVPLGLAITLGLALITDFAVWLAHYLQHRIPILWTFHKVHHAANQLTPLTVYRQHPVDLLLGAVTGSLLSGAALGVLTWISEEEATWMQFYGLNAVLFAFYVVGYNLRHSHVWLSFGPLDRIFVSPAMHQIHHSVARRHWDTNMGLVFSIWDQIFGTAYIPSEREELTFGIGPESARFPTFLHFWLEPFREVLGWVPSPEPAGGADGAAPPGIDHAAK